MDGSAERVDDEEDGASAEEAGPSSVVAGGSLEGEVAAARDGDAVTLGGFAGVVEVDVDPAAPPASPLAVCCCCCCGGVGAGTSTTGAPGMGMIWPVTG